MIIHYLKVAVRNLLRYKTQSVVSLLGLAVGFVCFALASLWIRYEMTYDDFHEAADRILCIRTEDKESVNGLSNINPYPLAGYLRETFAEVKGACSLVYSESRHRIDGKEIQLGVLSIDSAAFSVFDIRLLEGSMDFLLPGQGDKVAITRRCAQRLFGEENPIGKEIYSIFAPKRPITVCAVVSEWPEHSNLNYDLINRTISYDSWLAACWQTFVRLHPQADVKTFSDKLYNHVIEKGFFKKTHFVCTPLTTLRYDRPQIGANIKLQHVILFGVAGSLVILCALLNYITLFISRIHMRSHELALRTVHGASSRSLFLLLIAEYLLLLLCALVFGMMFIEILMSGFKELAEIKLVRSSIYAESAFYCLLVVAVSTLLSAFPILYYRRKSLQSVISNQKNGRDKNLIRKASVTFQLFVSIGFIFCAALMMKQLYFLNNGDEGMTRKNLASVALHSAATTTEMGDKIRKLPEVEEVLVGCNLLIPLRGSYMMEIEEWEEMSADAQPVTLHIVDEDTAFARFYGLRMVEGEMITEASRPTDIVLNESAVKAFGLSSPLGKYLKQGSTGYHIIGVMKDYHIEDPTMPVSPTAYLKDYSIQGFSISHMKDNVLFRYKEGTWKSCKKKIMDIIHSDYPDRWIGLNNTEEEYNKYLTSEQALLKLLGALALVCTLLSVFAIYSLVTLTCEQRRKEIAVRKVNGAMVKDILTMFMREYFTLLVIASILAFPVGYVLMKSWLENYTRQTEVGLWLFTAIFGGIALVIAFSISWRVWKAANENPADVVKSE